MLGMPGFNVSAWHGVAAPAGTSPAVVSALEQALQKIIQEPEIIRAMESRGVELGFMPATAMGAFVSADAQKWKRMASFAKITLG